MILDPVHFNTLPIGTRFDIVDPTSNLWGNPFYVKISATEYEGEGYRFKGLKRDGEHEETCYIVDDPLVYLVRQARALAAGDVAGTD